MAKLLKFAFSNYKYFAVTFEYEMEKHRPLLLRLWLKVCFWCAACCCYLTSIFRSPSSALPLPWFSPLRKDFALQPLDSFIKPSVCALKFPLPQWTTHSCCCWLLLLNVVAIAAQNKTYLFWSWWHIRKTPGDTHTYTYAYAQRKNNAAAAFEYVYFVL